jgi:UDP-N-acetylglucosamine acyltransferase
MSNIHATAIVDPGAQLDATVTVGAYSLIGPHVKIGAGTKVGPHCVIEGHTTIGQSNSFYQFSSIGADNQDMKYAGEPTELVIGDRKGVTRVGNDNWIMAYVHLAHDVALGNHCVLANGATLAGHVEVGDWVTIGGLTGVLQRMRIGAHAMIGFQGHVSQDVPPFMTVDGNPLVARAANLIGIKRRGFSDERIGAIRQMYKLLYRSSLTLEQSMAAIGQLRGQGADDDVELMLGFLAAATRGIVR